MRAREAGFTLLEMVVAIGIAVILLAAGGFWMLSMRPAALRGALDDFDSNLAAAKALAASSGNGATLVFAPQTDSAPGFTLRVYSGRPNASNAVAITNTMAAISATSVSEAHFGKPPFAIFLSSAGYPTGSANYPSLDAQENPTFNVIAQQPPCPSGGIVLTFTSPQGVTATRTLPCNTSVAFAAGADPTPTPNPPHISPTYLLAHYTTDSGPLKFKAAEYGYYHWYASTQNGSACQMGNSDTGAAPATFASPWPYAQPSPSSQGGAAPAAPEFAPYTWPVGDPNDPPAWFQLSPVLHNGGMCTVTVADDYNQSGTVQVQVMGDLTPSTRSLSLTVGKGNGSVNFTKTFDSELLLLSAGGPCRGVVNAATSSGSFPGLPSSTPATATVTVTPVTQGSCTMIVQDQYGEQVQIGINVAAPPQNFSTWPAMLVVGAGGAAVGITSAGAVYTGPCYAQAFGTSESVDTTLPASIANALAISVTTDGCILNADGSAPYGGSTPTGSGQTGNFTPLTTCGAIAEGSWNPPSASGAEASLPAMGTSAGQCTVNFSDGHSTQTPALDAGQVAVAVNACDVASGSGTIVLGTTGLCAIRNFTWPNTCGSDQLNNVMYYLAFNSGATSVAALVESSSYGMVSGSFIVTGTSTDGGTSGGITFTRIAPGAVTLYEYEGTFIGTFDELTGVCVIHEGFSQTPNSVTIN
jgi:prepilin-type N-terminal cleavage/methylation domain-containing protein